MPSEETSPKAKMISISLAKFVEDLNLQTKVINLVKRGQPSASSGTDNSLTPEHIAKLIFKEFKMQNRNFLLLADFKRVLKNEEKAADMFKLLDCHGHQCIKRTDIEHVIVSIVKEIKSMSASMADLTKVVYK